MRRLQLLFLGAAFLIVALPAICTIRPIIRDTPLHGVEHAEPRPFPAITVSSFLNERFQHDLADWLDEHIGLRGVMVRTENQLNLSLFNEISSDYGSPLVVGKNRTLMEKLYVDLANGAHEPDGKRVRVLAKRISHLSKMMRMMGVPLIVLLTPSKVSLDPGIVPERFLRRGAVPGGRNIGRFKQLLTERHVQVIDTKELLAARKGSSPWPIFPRSGTHWTVHSACYVADAIIDRIGTMRNKPLVRPVCDPPETADTPRPFDRDLSDLANVWFPETFYDRLPYPPTRELTESQPLKLMFVGGSFLWTVLDIFEQQKLYTEREMFYYFRRQFSFPSGTETRVRRRETNWSSQLPRFDAVILEINEAHINEAGGGFIGEAHKSLKKKYGEALK